MTQKEVNDMAAFKSETKKFKYNLIDFIFLIIVLALIAVGIWAIVNETVYSADTQSVTYTVEIHGVENEVASQLAVGDIISDRNTRSVLGTVSSISIKPEKIECIVDKTTDSVDENGEVSVLVEKVVNLADSNLYSTVVITCTAQADVTSTDITVNGIKLLSGENVAFYSRTFAGTGKIISIYKVVEQ